MHLIFDFYLGLSHICVNPRHNDCFFNLWFHKIHYSHTRSYTYPMTNYYLECIVSMDAAFHVVAICQSGFHTGILDRVHEGVLV